MVTESKRVLGLNCRPELMFEQLASTASDQFKYSCAIENTYPHVLEERKHLERTYEETHLCFRCAFCERLKQQDAPSQSPTLVS